MSSSLSWSPWQRPQRQGSSGEAHCSAGFLALSQHLKKKRITTVWNFFGWRGKWCAGTSLHSPLLMHRSNSISPHCSLQRLRDKSAIRSIPTIKIEVLEVLEVLPVAHQALVSLAGHFDLLVLLLCSCCLRVQSGHPVVEPKNWVFFKKMGISQNEEKSTRSILGYFGGCLIFGQTQTLLAYWMSSLVQHQTGYTSVLCEQIKRKSLLPLLVAINFYHPFLVNIWISMISFTKLTTEIPKRS